MLWDNEEIASILLFLNEGHDHLPKSVSLLVETTIFAMATGYFLCLAEWIILYRNARHLGIFEWTLNLGIRLYLEIASKINMYTCTYIRHKDAAVCQLNYLQLHESRRYLPIYINGFPGSKFIRITPKVSVTIHNESFCEAQTNYMAHVYEGEDLAATN